MSGERVCTSTAVRLGVQPDNYDTHTHTHTHNPYLPTIYTESGGEVSPSQLMLI